MRRSELIKMLKEHKKLIKRISKIKHTEGWEQCHDYYLLRVHEIEETIKRDLNLTIKYTSAGAVLI